MVSAAASPFMKWTPRVWMAATTCSAGFGRRVMPRQIVVESNFGSEDHILTGRSGQRFVCCSPEPDERACGGFDPIQKLGAFTLPLRCSGIGEQELGARTVGRLAYRKSVKTPIGSKPRGR